MRLTFKSLFISVCVSYRLRYEPAIEMYRISMIKQTTNGMRAVSRRRRRCRPVDRSVSRQSVGPRNSFFPSQLSNLIDYLRHLYGGERAKMVELINNNIIELATSKVYQTKTVRKFSLTHTQ